jgi:hypothetical protein
LLRETAHALQQKLRVDHLLDEQRRNELSILFSVGRQLAGREVRSTRWTG